MRRTAGAGLRGGSRRRRAGVAAAAAALAGALLTLGGPAPRAAPGDHGGSAAPGAPAPAHLSDTGLYADAATRRVAPDVLPYTPQYPLWSDGAAKRRWIRLPPGTAIDASDPDAWVFPVGTRLWKEFSFGRRVETRYMERTGDGKWLFAAYAWTPDGADALLVPEGGLRAAAESRPGLPHDIPSVYDCRACHEGGPTPVLGFSSLQLSPDRDPLAAHAERPGAGDVELPALVARGLVRGLPQALLDRPPRIEAPTGRARAALGYLHANCGICHDSRGQLAPLGLSLVQRVSAPGGAGAALATASDVPCRFHPPGTEGAALVRIRPGRPADSVLVARMASRDPLVQMPPLGSHAVDDEAVALVSAWIRELRPRAPTLSRSTHPKEEAR
ncbi:hypothetical protein [Anaeromyxobacter sp. Fw109-5]|uniref:hypothetical protein n=1 Tax=Anaeromyxobacter sp. (strain Fw109-5) TaxID=404589 RepID=UPI0000ED801E|nr:hypothetical protein [Anaeromyxobacter sp. Fw109-5]ABS27114.1 conserved hypothetical protein [Anaeromyxobacter sp. Fw109-5]